MHPFALARDLPLVCAQPLDAEDDRMGTHADSTGLEQRHPAHSVSKRPGRPVPQPGDVLAAARAARADVYRISIVPAAAHLRATRHAEALDTVRELARGLGVDGWFTCNSTHYARIASFRGRERTRGRAASQRQEVPDEHVD